MIYETVIFSLKTGKSLLTRFFSNYRLAKSFGVKFLKQTDELFQKNEYGFYIDVESGKVDVSDSLDINEQVNSFLSKDSMCQPVLISEYVPGTKRIVKGGDKNEIQKKALSQDDASVK